MESNADHWPTEKLRMAYIQKHVEKLALSHLERRLRKDSPRPFETSGAIMEYLEEVYGDPHGR